MSADPSGAKNGGKDQSVDRDGGTMTRDGRKGGLDLGDPEGGCGIGEGCQIQGKRFKGGLSDDPYRPPGPSLRRGAGRGDPQNDGHQWGERILIKPQVFELQV